MSSFCWKIYSLNIYKVSRMGGTHTSQQLFIHIHIDPETQHCFTFFRRPEGCLMISALQWVPAERFWCRWYGNIKNVIGHGVHCYYCARLPGAWCNRVDDSNQTADGLKKWQIGVARRRHQNYMWKRTVCIVACNSLTNNASRSNQDTATNQVSTSLGKTISSPPPA